MAEQTINYGLVKPAPDEFYDVSVPNRNIEIIDSKMKELETKKAEEQDLRTLSNTVSLVTDDTAIKEMTLSSGTKTVSAKLKSTVNVKRIDGKTIVNLPPLFDSGVWAYTAPFTVVAPNELTITPTTTLTDQGSGRIRVKPNTPHTLNAKLTNALLGMTEYTDDAVPVATAHHTKPLTLPYTFTTKSNTGFLRIWLYETALNVKATFKDITLVEGSQTQPFVANVKGVTNPTIANETNGTSQVVPTTLYAGEYVEEQPNGELVKYKKFQELILTGDLTWNYNGKGAGFKQVSILINGARGANNFDDYNSSIVVSHDGKVIKVSDPALKADAHYINSQNKYLILSIPNTVSGWGELYQPTPEEMKAFALGWRMYADGVSTEYYNGTGNKAWQYRDDNGNLIGGTGFLPTTQAPINSKWQPYRLIYELATPVFETIKPYGDLTLEKGDNQVKVYAGRIVNEKSGIQLYTGEWYINGTGVPLSKKVSRIGVVRKNSIKDLTAKVIPVVGDADIAKVGIEYVSLQTYDPTAAYTVDYEPLYTWEVTTPIDAVQLTYFGSLQAVTKRLVADSAKQQDIITRMLENVVNEDSDIVWIRPTFINGVTGTPGCRFGKDTDGTVYLYIYITLPRAMTSADEFFRLPKGYRPHDTIYVSAIEYQDNTKRAPGIISISPNGAISTGIPTAYTTTHNVIAMMTFKARRG